MDDSFATPVSKLPTPVMTVRDDHPPAESLNYTDILNKFNESAPQQQQHVTYTPPVTPQAEYIPPPQQPPQQYMTTTPMYSHQVPLDTHPHPPVAKAKTPVLSTDVVYEKSVWLFALIMFIGIVYGLPKLRQFPVLTNPSSGGLTTFAVAGVSIISGVLFTVSSRFV